MSKILVVDDQAGMRRSLAILLRKEGFCVDEAQNGQHAVSCLDEEPFDIVITDLKMSPGTGFDVLYYVKEKHPRTDVIIMTGFGTIDSAVLAMRMGAFDYLPKPFKNEEILHRVRKSLSHLETEKEMDSIKQAAEGKRKGVTILGESKAIKETIALAQKIASVDLPVLITGETGTGKNLVASTIHNLSSRSGKPFVSINCAAVPEYLLESELFGHTKGAFTGALLDRKGLFEEADGGSLVLDEIGSMPYTMQAKLLDVLQNRIIRKVGGNKTKDVDVRVMAVTNSNLEQAIRTGKFREDLYYRIKVTHIHLPPLRDYPEDIPLLSRHFLQMCQKEFRNEELRFSPEVTEFLSHYDFPGNVRELHNIICSSAAMSSGPEITVEGLSLSFTSNIFDLSATEAGEGEARAFDQWERDLIEKSIKKHSHNLSKVCNELGIGRTTLWRKMKRYNIQ